MKKKIMSVLLALTVCLALMPAAVAVESDVWDGSVAYGFGGGSGTQSDPYQIFTASQLAYLSQSVRSDSSTFAYRNTYFSLEADLDLNRLSWTPIGNDDHHFCGSFQGNGHTISNLYSDRPAEEYIGLFGNIWDGSVAGVHLKDAAVRGAKSVGGLVGRFSGVSVSKCSVTGSVAGSDSTGGLVGTLSKGTITDCTNGAAVNGGKYTGGVAGFAPLSSSITRCVNTGRISANGQCCGGILGYGCPVSDCFNAGTVSGTTDVGGIAGEPDSVKNCGNIGSISGSRNVGGIFGEIVNGTAENCYHAGSVSGNPAGTIGGYAMGTVIQNNYYQSGSGGSVLGKQSTSHYPDTLTNNQSVYNCATQEFADTMNASVDSYFGTTWTRDASQFSGYPFIELRSLSDLRVSGAENVTVYAGNSFDGEGLSVQAVYDDGSTTDLSPGTYSVSPGTPLNEGYQMIQISYQGRTASVGITVLAPAPVYPDNCLGHLWNEADVRSAAGNAVRAIAAAYDSSGKMLRSDVTGLSGNDLRDFLYFSLDGADSAAIFFVDSQSRPVAAPLRMGEASNPSDPGGGSAVGDIQAFNQLADYIVTYGTSNGNGGYYINPYNKTTGLVTTKVTLAYSFGDTIRTGVSINSENVYDAYSINLSVDIPPDLVAPFPCLADYANFSLSSYEFWNTGYYWLNPLTFNRTSSLTQRTVTFTDETPTAQQSAQLKEWFCEYYNDYVLNCMDDILSMYGMSVTDLGFTDYNAW